MKDAEQHKLLLETLPVACWTRDHDGRTTFITPNIEKVLGYTQSEVCGGGFFLWTGCIHADDRERMEREFSRLFSEKAAYCVDYRIRRKDGQWIWLRDKAADTFEENGNVFASGIIHDITEQKSIEHNLTEAQKRFQQLVDNSSDWIWAFDENNIFTYSSPAVETLLGYTAEEITGMSAFDIIPSPEKEKVLKEFQSSKDEHKPFSHLENINQHKDGHLVPIESSGIPMFDSEGNFKGYQGIDRNISERKRLEQQLVRAQKMEAIGTLAGGIAHDFNNILNAIMGFSDLVRLNMGKTDPSLHYVDEILSASQRARNLVKQILSFSRKLDREKVIISLDPIIRETVSFMRASLPATISIETSIQSTTVTVLADPSQIHRVLVNLCTNAAHAMEKEGGTLFISLKKSPLEKHFLTAHPDLSNTSFLKLSVGDTGTGIDPHILDKVFDPYFTTKEQEKGSGLGLAVAQGIVKNHNGFMGIDNRPGFGVTFNIFLPITESHPLSDATESTIDLPGGNERILFVDDEEPIIKANDLGLRKLGYHVSATTSSEEALAMFFANPDAWDLVITDQTMPGLTGEQLTKSIYAMRPDLPVIVCSGYSQIIDESSAKAFGAAAFLMKPVRLKLLATKIREVLNG